MSRWRAAGIHVLVSMTVVVLACLLMLNIWFPNGLLSIAGMSRFVLLLLCIDLCIGPLLTLIVYKADKPRLKLDLAVIVCLQLGFFAYGLHIIWQGRPAYLVGVVDRFTLVFAHQVETEPGDPATPLGRPRLVGARLPSDPKEWDAVLFAALAGGADVDMRPKYYVPFAEVAPGLRARARTLASLRLTQSERELLVREAESAGLSANTALVLPAMSSRAKGLALMSPQDMQPRRVVGLDGYALLDRTTKK